MASSRNHWSWVIPILIAVLLSFPGAVLAQQGSGAITGRVTGPEGEARANASVTLAGTNLATKTDYSGNYRLAPVPAGEHTIVIVYLGLGAASETVTVTAGQTVTRNVKLAYTESIEVIGTPLLLGQAKALNEQENAINITNVVASDQIGRFPDLNAAEATQRIPAISLLRDQGEGRYVLIRGTESRLNSTTVNGERLPSPEAGVRNVALDTIPVDLLEAIQVSKALTPDMDGDAIGGTVDLVTKRAPLEPRIAASIGGGYAAITEDSLGIATLTLGRRFRDGQTGLLFSASGNIANRGSDDVEPEYDDGELDELQLRDYTLTRERYGLTFSIDHQVSSSAELYLRGMLDEYEDDEIRRARGDVVGKNEMERAVRDRVQSSRITSLTAGGSNVAGEAWVISYRAAWNKAREQTPDQVTSVFVQEDVEFEPNVGPDSINPDDIQANPQNEDINEYVFDSIEDQYKRAEEEDLVGSVDVMRAFYRDNGFSGLWKFGAKARFKDKTQNYEVFDFESEDDLFLSDFLSTWTPDTPYIGGRYTLGPFQDPGAMRRLLDSGVLDGERNLEEDLADFTVSEDTTAAYAMAELSIGPDMTILAGLRAERTKTEYTAYELVFDEEGDPSDLTPVTGSKNYTQILPQVHLKYHLAERSYLRAAITKSFARPDFEHLAPFQLINREDEEISRGNPDLDVTKAWNFDLLFEQYLESVGILSAGVFYKRLEDNIFYATFDEEHNGADYEVTQPVNADRGWLRGLEMAFQKRFGALPPPWDGLGIYFNYTLADSESSYPDRQETTLPGQSKHVGNLALSYEKKGFSGRISLNYNGKSLFEVGGGPEEDLYVDNHLQVDFSAQQQLTKKVALYVEAINLTNEPYRVYEGTSDRPRQEEYYKWWGTIGLKFNL